MPFSLNNGIAMQFKNILVVADGTPGAALRRAVTLAKANDGRVTVVAVVAEPGRAPTKNTQWLRDVVLQEREQKLRQVVSRAAGQDVDIAVKVLLGSPFIEIIREVSRNRHDLVLKVAEGAGKRRERLLGSTDTHLVRKCPCPVWIMASPRTRRFARIMAAVEANTSDAKRRALDRAILQLATGLAEVEDGELHVLHAWSLFGEEALKGPLAGTSGLEFARLLEETRSQEQAALHEIIGPFTRSALKVHQHLVKGQPADVISRAVEKHRIGLLVMGTVGRTGIPGFVIGNTAEKVLNWIDCSLVALKPDGFVSPVKPR